MTVEDLEAAIAERSAPSHRDPLVTALWHDALGDWARAHELAQDVKSPEGAWVHAYLHRKEGDLDNARYWYRRAARPEAVGALQDEWRAIARALLDEGREGPQT